MDGELCKLETELVKKRKELKQLRRRVLKAHSIHRSQGSSVGKKEFTSSSKGASDEALQSGFSVPVFPTSSSCHEDEAMVDCKSEVPPFLAASTLQDPAACESSFHFPAATTSHNPAKDSHCPTSTSSHDLTTGTHNPTTCSSGPTAASSLHYPSVAATDNIHDHTDSLMKESPRRKNSDAEALHLPSPQLKEVISTEHKPSRSLDSTSSPNQLCQRSPVVGFSQKNGGREDRVLECSNSALDDTDDPEGCCSQPVQHSQMTTEVKKVSEDSSSQVTAEFLAEKRVFPPPAHHHWEGTDLSNEEKPVTREWIFFPPPHMTQVSRCFQDFFLPDDGFYTLKLDKLRNTRVQGFSKEGSKKTSANVRRLMKEKTERVGVLSPDTLGSPLTLKPSTDEVRKAAFSKRTKWILKEKCQTGDATYQWIEWDNQGNVRETLNLESRACFITEHDISASTQASRSQRFIAALEAGSTATSRSEDRRGIIHLAFVVPEEIIVCKLSERSDCIWLTWNLKEQLQNENEVLLHLLPLDNDDLLTSLAGNVGSRIIVRAFSSCGGIASVLTLEDFSEECRRLLSGCSAASAITSWTVVPSTSNSTGRAEACVSLAMEGCVVVWALRMDQFYSECVKNDSGGHLLLRVPLSCDGTPVGFLPTCLWATVEEDHLFMLLGHKLGRRESNKRNQREDTSLPELPGNTVAAVAWLIGGVPLAQAEVHQTASETKNNTRRNAVTVSQLDKESCYYCYSSLTSCCRILKQYDFPPSSWLEEEGVSVSSFKILQYSWSSRSRKLAVRVSEDQLLVWDMFSALPCGAIRLDNRKTRNSTTANNSPVERTMSSAPVGVVSKSLSTQNQEGNEISSAPSSTTRMLRVVDYEDEEKKRLVVMDRSGRIHFIH